MTERPDEAVQGDAPPASAGAPDTLEALRAQLAAEQERAQQYQHNWQRAAADFQNYKRRTEEERQKNALYANLALVLNILPIYDDFERALANLDVTLAGLQWVEGVRQISRKFQGALDASGVKEVEADGQPFDPNLHEAIAEGDGPVGVVVRVVQKGYTMGERVIRPAMVIVGNGQDKG